jgi:hypothetical protein
MTEHSQSSKPTEPRKSRWWHTTIGSQVLSGLIVAAIIGAWSVSNSILQAREPLHAQVAYFPYYDLPKGLTSPAEQLLQDNDFGRLALALENVEGSNWDQKRAIREELRALETKITALATKVALEDASRASIQGTVVIELDNTGGKKINEIYVKVDNASFYAEVIDSKTRYDSKVRSQAGTSRGVRVDELMPGESKKIIAWTTWRYESRSDLRADRISVVYSEGRALVSRSSLTPSFWSFLAEDWPLCLVALWLLAVVVYWSVMAVRWFLEGRAHR